jgi:hypothetical protein
MAVPLRLRNYVAAGVRVKRREELLIIAQIIEFPHL